VRAAKCRCILRFRQGTTTRWQHRRGSRRTATLHRTQADRPKPALPTRTRTGENGAARSGAGRVATLRTIKTGSATNWRDGHRPGPVIGQSRFFLALGASAFLVGAAVYITAAASLPQSRSARNAGSAARRPTSSSISFSDVTRASGIDLHLTCGSLEKRYIMETMCGGVAVFDYDNDGWMDIFLVNGSTLADLRSGKCHPSKLYRNNHDGTFTDV